MTGLISSERKKLMLWSSWVLKMGKPAEKKDNGGKATSFVLQNFLGEKEGALTELRRGLNSLIPQGRNDCIQNICN